VRLVAKLLPHVSIILSGMLIVFVFLDRFNPSMGYLTNEAVRVLLVVLAVTSVVNATLLIRRQRRDL
jgi:hypothetical protein